MFVSVTLPLKKKFQKIFKKISQNLRHDFYLTLSDFLNYHMFTRKLAFFTRSDITCLNILMPLERHNIEWPTLSILLSEHMIQYFSIHKHIHVNLPIKLFCGLEDGEP